MQRRFDEPTAVLTRGYGHIGPCAEDLAEGFERLIFAGTKETWSPRPAPVPGRAYPASPIRRET